MPYSGPASAYGTVGLLEQAYFEMINARGGVNGRKIKLIRLASTTATAHPRRSSRRAGWSNRKRYWPSSDSWGR